MTYYHIYKKYKCFCFICAILIFMSSMATAQTDKFLSSKNQLSNSHINSIYQDKEGLMWICTENGLNIFNGTSVSTFFHSEKDSTSINSNSILCVLEDSHGNFWIGTSSGLQRYDRERNVFTDFPLTYPKIRTISSINYLMEDSKGNIWISCSGNGIIRLNSETFEPIFYMLSNSNICSNIISCLFEDKYGNIWIGSADNGISILNEGNSTIVNYAHDPNNRKSLSNNKVNSICEDNDGAILIGTIGGGVNKYHLQSRSFERVMNDAGKLIYTLFKDNSGKLWIGTDGNGLFFVDSATKQLQRYESNLANIDLQTTKIHGIYQDHMNNMWFALFQNGVLMSPSKLNPFRNIGFNPFHPEKSIGTHCVLSLLKDRKDQLWIGTEGGLYKFDKNGKLLHHYHSSTTDRKSVV